VNRRCVYCGHGRPRNRDARFGTIPWGRPWPARWTSRFRRQRSWAPPAAHRSAGGLDQEDRTLPRRESLGRVLPSLDHRLERPAGAPETVKYALPCLDAKTLGAAEVGRVH